MRKMTEQINRHKGESEGFVLGVLVGAVVGGVLGLLYAPEEGRKTRTKLKAVLEEKGEGARDMIESLTDEIASAKKKTEPLLNELAEKVAPLVNKMKKQNL